MTHAFWDWGRFLKYAVVGSAWAFWVAQMCVLTMLLNALKHMAPNGDAYCIEHLMMDETSHLLRVDPAVPKWSRIMKSM